MAIGRFITEESTLGETPKREREGIPLAPDRFALALVLLWSHDEPERIGEVVVVPPTARGLGFTIGRAIETYDDGSAPLMWRQLRPYSVEHRGPLQSPRVSRWQIRVALGAGDELALANIGKGELRVNNQAVPAAVVRPGDTIEAVGRFLLQVTRRPLDWPRATTWPDPFAFGTADRFGLVGESPAAWQLRRQILFLARRDDHVLVEGPTGAGKELVVRAIHAASSRGSRPLIARNAATIPNNIIDAELFGNMANYPSPGAPDRGGLFGEADGSSLFLDEIGELSQALQASLLRVMDSGEYQRLGEARMRASQVRVLAATNRDPGELKRDFVARFAHRLRVPGFEERSEDIVLVARHLLRGFAARDPLIGQRFIVADEPVMSARMVDALTRHRYLAQVRELVEVLWRAIAQSSSAAPLEVPPEFLTRSARGSPAVAAETTDPRELTREEIVDALAAAGGVRDRAWRALGLRSRDQLKRLLKKYDIT